MYILQYKHNRNQSRSRKRSSAYCLAVSAPAEGRVACACGKSTSYSATATSCSANLGYSLAWSRRLAAVKSHLFRIRLSMPYGSSSVRSYYRYSCRSGANTGSHAW